jgi:hypothetical protein
MGILSLNVKVFRSSAEGDILRVLDSGGSLDDSNNACSKAWIYFLNPSLNSVSS